MTNWKVWRFIPAVLGVALLAGCAEVSTLQPLPQAKLSAEDQMRFEGTWVLQIDNGAPYTLAFDCAGTAHLAVLDWKDGQFMLDQAVIYIARGKHSDADSGFISFPDKNVGHPSAYPFMRYAFVSPQDLVIWWPDPAPFAAAIKARKLKGSAHIDQGKQIANSAEITSTPQEVLDFLDDPTNNQLFVYDKPYLFRKVAGSGGSHAACGK